METLVKDQYTSSDEEKIMQAVLMARPSIQVIGIGGAGCNIVTWMKERGVEGARILALNTDAQHMTITKADRRILIGEKLCRGMGCGGYPEKGAEAAKEALETISREVNGTNLVFIVTGLGGGTGTGASWVISQSLKETGALTIGVTTFPFAVERARFEKAKVGLQHLRSACDTVVVIDNDQLRKIAGDMPLKQAFAVANELIGSFVKNITETITSPSLINIDFADLKAIMDRGGISAIGIGQADGQNRIEKAVKMALDTPLLDLKDVNKATGVLIHIAGGDDMTLGEVTKAGELVTRSLYSFPRAFPKTTRIVWGAKVDDRLTGHVKVMVVLTGVQSKILS